MEQILMSKQSKYKDQLWVTSNDGIQLLICISEYNVNITSWDSKKRLLNISKSKKQPSKTRNFDRPHRKPQPSPKQKLPINIPIHEMVGC